VDALSDNLKKHNLKNTPRRNAIIEIFKKKNLYLSPEEVWITLKKKFKKCGLPGVYRNLESMSNCGILFKIVSFSDDKRHYGLCNNHINKHHHHIICIKCKKISSIEKCGFNNRIKINGYEIISHFVQLNGICPDCQNKN